MHLNCKVVKTICEQKEICMAQDWKTTCEESRCVVSVLFVPFATGRVAGSSDGNQKLWHEQTGLDAHRAAQSRGERMTEPGYETRNLFFGQTVPTVPGDRPSFYEARISH